MNTPDRQPLAYDAPRNVALDALRALPGETIDKLVREHLEKRQQFRHTETALADWHDQLVRALVDERDSRIGRSVRKEWERSHPPRHGRQSAEADVHWTP